MTAEQLSLLGLAVEVPVVRLARPRARRSVVTRPTEPATVELVAGAVLVAHCFPEAFDLLREHGADSVAVLHVLVVQAEPVDGRLVVAASTRGVAERLGFLSKDSVHRRLRQLRRAGVIEALPSTGPMDPPTFVVHLDGTGITVTHPSR